MYSSLKKKMNAIALFQNPKGVQGTVTFYQDSPTHPVRVVFDLRGFQPDQTHAIHIHEFGDTRQGCMSLGGHYNPFGTTHGSRDHPEHPRHAGDLINNLQTDHRGRFQYQYEDPLLSLWGSETIYGRSIVIHEGRDDLGLGNNPDSLKTGNAGGRMACAIIGRSGN